MNKRTLSYALERVLVLFVVSSAATCFGLLFGDLISHFTSFNFIPWIFSIYIVLTSAVALCVSWIFLNEEASVFANFRFLVFYEIFSIILFSFIVPGVPLYMAMPPSIIGWFLTVKLDKAFTCHTSFMENCGDLSGQALASMLHEQNWLTSDFVEQTDDSLFKLGILSFIDFVFFLILFFTGVSISVLTVLFLIAHVALIILTLLLSSIYKNETYYAGMGLSSVFAIRNRLLKISIFFCTISIIAALLISSNYALLKPSYFAWLLEWIRSLFSKKTGTVSQPAPIPAPQESFSMGNLPFDKGDYTSNPITDTILLIIKIAGIAAITGGILFFFFGPFFSAKWKEFWKSKKLATYLKRIWATLRSMIKALFGMRIKRGEAYAKAAADFKDKISTILEASKKSKEKKKEIDRLTTQFLKLIEWGEERDIAYKKNLAPAEYTSLISERYPALGALADAAGALFEKALYAKELLTPEEEKRFVEAVTKVTKSDAQ